MLHATTAAVLLAAFLSADKPPGDAPADKDKPANRLARETSPYLLQHAHNPVDWYPWGDAAFAKARKEGKLIFLSIGYSSCHWCHVMERECFENEEVAKLLNKDFVCVKVDREERPEVDNIYMTALSAMGRRGGWPLSVFLTADGKPFLGGTYWPPEDKEIDGETVHGFKSILKAVKRFQDEHADDLDKRAGEVADRTNELLAGEARGKALVSLDRDLVAGAVDALKDEFDKTHGGFGEPARSFRGTKFPMPPRLLLLQHEAARAKAKDLDDVVQTTLDHVARGGIYDHLGGGFHRYSTERTWTVPHFEKMLYDNAQLCEVYAQAYQDTKNPLYKRVVTQTLAFVERELTAPDGGFYSALDADADGEEGRFTVWTDKEIDAVLTDKDDAALFKKVYGADGEPNFDGKRILLLPKPLAESAKDLKLTEAQLEERLAPMRKKTFEAREKRPRPFRDTKILTAWNGQMIAGYAAAGQALGDKKYTEAAARAADFVLTNLRGKDGRLRRTYGAAPGGKAEARLDACLDDYAYLIHGLLNLHDATGDKRWLDEAKALADVMAEWYADKDGGFFYTANDHEKLFARTKDQYDGVQPSGNSLAVRDLVRLWVKTGDDKYARQAEKTFKAFAGALKANPSSLPALADALALYLDAKEKNK
jgi:uncharacterized protein YyaL (SSP411 family)